MEKQFNEYMREQKRDPTKTYKKCIFGCSLGSHPYGSLRLCPVILAKSTSVLRALTKNREKVCCFRCYTPHVYLRS